MSFKNLNFIVLSSLFIVTACNQKSEFYENASESPLETRVVTPPPPTGTSPILNPGDEIADKDQEIPAGENPVVSNPGTPVVNNPGTPVVNNPGTPVVNNPGTPVENNPGTPVENNPGNPVVSNPEKPVLPDLVYENLPEEIDENGTSKEKDCRYSFSATKIGSNVKITVISGSIEKLKSMDHPEIQKLSQENKSFILNGINNKLEGIPVVKSTSKTSIGDSNKLVIKNDQAAVAKYNKIESGVSLNYYLEGKSVSFSGTSLHRGSQLYTVVNGADQASVSFTSIQDGSEVFVVFITNGDNITCVSATGVDGRVASYVYGEENHITQGQISGTSFDDSGSIIHHVIGGSDTLSSFKGTSLKEAQLDFKTIGAKKAATKLQFTSLGENNIFNFDLRSKDSSLLTLTGTNAGKDSQINLAMTGQNSAQANFKFTNEQNIRISGEISSRSPSLNLLGKLKDSPSAKVNVTLIKN